MRYVLSCGRSSILLFTNNLGIAISTPSTAEANLNEDAAMVQANLVDDNVTPPLPISSSQGGLFICIQLNI